jgi:hypothetical protein
MDDSLTFYDLDVLCLHPDKPLVESGNADRKESQENLASEKALAGFHPWPDQLVSGSISRARQTVALALGEPGVG